MVAYNRLYPGMEEEHLGKRGAWRCSRFRTTQRSGFDTILHSAKATYDIIRHNRADVVHIQNGGNSIFAAVLRLFGKKTFLSQDGLDWKRDKWSWYAKLYLWLSSLLTAHVNNAVIFDNVYAREAFETRFKKSYDFIPFGADVKYDEDAERVLERTGARAWRILPLRRAFHSRQGPALARAGLRSARDRQEVGVRRRIAEFLGLRG